MELVLSLACVFEAIRCAAFTKKASIRFCILNYVVIQSTSVISFKDISCWFYYPVTV